MTNNMISIIIPIFNNGSALEKCLKSVRDQTYTNIEVLMINDGSTDNSEKICKQFVEEDERFRYYYQDNSGVSAARNNGIRNINGDYFTFIDSDDWVELNYCKSMFEKAIEEESDMVFCYMNRIINGISNPQEENAMVDVVKNKQVENFLIGHPQYVQGSSCRILYKSNSLKHIRFCEDLHIYEDLIYLLSCINSSQRLSIVNEYLYNYEISTVGYLKKYYREDIFDICYNVGKKLYDILCSLNKEKWAKAELFKEYCLALDWLIDSKYDKIKQNELKHHVLTLEFCNKTNYKAYNELYAMKFTSKLRTWMIYNKYFALYKGLSTVKKHRRTK